MRQQNLLLIAAAGGAMIVPPRLSLAATANDVASNVWRADATKNALKETHARR